MTTAAIPEVIPCGNNCGRRVKVGPQAAKLIAAGQPVPCAQCRQAALMEAFPADAPPVNLDINPFAPSATGPKPAASPPLAPADTPTADAGPNQPEPDSPPAPVPVDKDTPRAPEAGPCAACGEPVSPVKWANADFRPLCLKCVNNQEAFYAVCIACGITPEPGNPLEFGGRHSQCLPGALPRP